MFFMSEVPLCMPDNDDKQVSPAGTQQAARNKVEEVILTPVSNANTGVCITSSSLLLASRQTPVYCISSSSSVLLSSLKLSDPTVYRPYGGPSSTFSTPSKPHEIIFCSSHICIYLELQGCLAHKKLPPLAPCSRPRPRTLRWSYGGGSFL